MSNNSASLLLPGGYLPRARPLAAARAQRPAMDLMGPLAGHRANAVVAGDVRANENIALTATHTLFAREHNRIVSRLPASLSAEERFQIARRIVGAEQQYITYHEFLPALGVHLAPYRGYDPTSTRRSRTSSRPSATASHSMIHGEFEPHGAGEHLHAARSSRRSSDEGVEVERDGQATSTLVIPLDLAFGNPDLLQAGRPRPAAQGPRRRAAVQERRADRQVAAQRPVPDPEAREPRPGCLRRADRQARLLLGRPGPRRDRHRSAGATTACRTTTSSAAAYGLAPKSSFTAITGESTAQLPAQPPDQPTRSDRRPEHPRLHEARRTRTARSIAARQRRGRRGRRRRDPPHDARRAAEGDLRRRERRQGRRVRRDALRAARRAEPSSASSSSRSGRSSSQALRDGDRFFYLNDPDARPDQAQYGIDYRHTLAQIIQLNTGE